jgi:hypothetical protein
MPYHKCCASTSLQRIDQLEMSDQNPLDARNSGAGSLIQADRIVGAVIQLGRARRLMIRNLLSVLDCTTILQVRRNAGSPEGMAAGRVRQSSLPGAAFYHDQHF